MAVQTTYALEHAEAYEGMCPDLQLANTISKLNKSGVNIPYGFGVVYDGDGAAVLPAAAFAVEDIIGIALRELDRAYQDGEVFGAQDTRQFTVLTAGPIWVTTATGSVPGDSVFLEVGGAIRSVTTAGAIQIPNAKFTTTAQAGALAKISLVVGG